MPDSARRAAERYWLLYTPGWGAAVGAIMLTGVAERWSDAELIPFGLLVMAGAVVGPLVFRIAEDRGKPFHQLAAFRLSVWLVAFSFLLNYFGTKYFYELLHAHYGFQTQVQLNDVPLFLYFVTVAYFATYFALFGRGWSLIQRLPRGPFLVAAALLPFVIAGLESVLNANPFMTGLYCFDDLGHALGFGTLFYGVWFVVVMPFWTRMETSAATRLTIRRALLEACAATMLCVCAAELIKYNVAPHFTDVADGHIGLRDYGDSCLTPPRLGDE